MFLNWKTYHDDPNVLTQYVATYRSCTLRIAYMKPHKYTTFVERGCVICTAYFYGKNALHRAKLAAPKLANVMIQHAATHHESKGRVR